MTGEPLSRTTILLDCRWLGLGGAGRATELLLAGLRELQPAGRWLLWGPSAARASLWSAARWREAGGPPTRLWGQRELLQVPRCDVAIYPHQIRPLRPGPSITLIHDTIPLRHGSPATRRFKRAFLRSVGRLSSRILTVSEFSRRCIETDLGVPAHRISVIRYPVDGAMVARVQELRSRLPQRDLGLYVGRFAPHKNLMALIEAFEATGFRRRRGTLLLAGGDPDEVRALRDFVRSRGHDAVSVEGQLPEGALEEAYATSRFLVLPSLEEGFGLPVWEAMACGLPVCVSDGGALPEITRGFARPFPARSIGAMTEAIDRVSATPPGPPPDLGAPTLREFARAFVEEVERVATRLA